MRSALLAAVLMLLVPALAVDAIKVGGRIALDPDPTTLNLAPTGHMPEALEQCTLQRTREACEATSASVKGMECAGSKSQTTPEACRALAAGCAWVPGPLEPGPLLGRATGGGAACLPGAFAFGPPMDTSDFYQNRTITVRLDGIATDLPATAFVFSAPQAMEKDLMRYPPIGVVRVPPGQTAIAVTAGADHFSPGRIHVRVCINASECPLWGGECSTCTDHRQAVGWTDPETGEAAAAPIPPQMTVERRFEGAPSLWEDEVEQVTATLEIWSPSQPWSADCRIRAQNEDKANTIPLCPGSGVFEPNVCQPQPATGEGAATAVVTLTYDVIDWYAGSYELECALKGENGEGSVFRDTFFVKRRIPIVSLKAPGAPSLPPPTGPGAPSPGGESASPAPGHAQTLPILTPRPPETPGGGGALQPTEPAACGNNQCDKGELDSGSCCTDCGCPPGRLCRANSCVEAPSPTPAATAYGAAAGVAAIVVLVGVVGLIAMRPRAEGP